MFSMSRGRSNAILVCRNREHRDWCGITVWYEKTASGQKGLPCIASQRMGAEIDTITTLIPANHVFNFLSSF